MSPSMAGIAVLVTMLGLLGAGTPIAFALGFVAVAALVLSEGFSAIGGLSETFFAGLANFGMVSVPMFILMGAAVASSPAGRDLYEALDRWLYRVPGGMVMSNIGACALFAALSGSSPATCAAIGKMGIPEMTKRGYPDSLAAGSIAAGGTLGILIPPSVTMIVYGISTETSIGRLFLAGLLPGLMLTVLFMAWALIDCWRKGIALGDVTRRYSLAERLENLPRVLPFLLIVAAILFVLYGGVATPSEAAGTGALICILLVAIIYRMWRAGPMIAIFRDTIREAVMIMLIIGAAELFAFALSSLFITQTVAGAIA
ncbi:MAG: TRAP transporter large permease, partial [Paracoccus sp. (in: a-proteobacteria)]